MNGFMAPVHVQCYEQVRACLKSIRCNIKFSSSSVFG